MKAKYAYETAARFGIRAMAEDIAYRAATRLARVTILKGVRLTMDSVDPTFLDEDGGCRWSFLDAGTLHDAVRRGTPLAMDAAFVDGALARGDLCYGGVTGGDVVAYGWYSNQPTPVTAIADDMQLHFDPSYSYMYRGYTLPEHRGKRLHGIGMARAMQSLVNGGARGLVSCVDAANFASLASCYRLGYRDFGRIFCAEIGGTHFTYSTPGCRAYAFRLGAEDRWTPARSSAPPFTPRPGSG